MDFLSSNTEHLAEIAAGTENYLQLPASLECQSALSQVSTMQLKDQPSTANRLQLPASLESQLARS